MNENLQHIEKKPYTLNDLDRAKNALDAAEKVLNSIDLSEDDANISEAIQAKKNWQEARERHNKIYKILHPEESNQS